MLWTSTVTLASRSAFCMTATASTARTTPGIVPRAAEDVDAAEQDDGHDGQGHALRRRRPGRSRGATVRMTPASAAIEPGQHEQADPHPGDADAGVAGRAGVLADRVDLAADPRPVEDDAEDRRRGARKIDERPRDQRPGHVAEAERR